MAESEVYFREINLVAIYRTGLEGVTTGNKEAS